MNKSEDLKVGTDVCNSMKKKLSIPGEKVGSETKDLESFVGSNLPEEVEIHQPRPSSAKGSGKRIKGGNAAAGKASQTLQILRPICSSW